MQSASSAAVSGEVREDPPKRQARRANKTNGGGSDRATSRSTCLMEERGLAWQLISARGVNDLVENGDREKEKETRRWASPHESGGRARARE